MSGLLRDLTSLAFVPERVEMIVALLPFAWSPLVFRTIRVRFTGRHGTSEQAA